MSQKSSEGGWYRRLPPVPVSPVQEILLVDRFSFRRRDYEFSATSLPGHLLHLVVSGQVRQECNGREYILRPGSVMWYHEDELVRGQSIQAPWVFYSVNFLAPGLPPPPFETRLIAQQFRLRPLFERLLAAWRDTSEVGLTRRSFKCHALLLEILGGLLPTVSAAATLARIDPGARLWWELESELRKDLRHPVSLREMVALTGQSSSTIARALASSQSRAGRRSASAGLRWKAGSNQRPS